MGAVVSNSAAIDHSEKYPRTVTYTFNPVDFGAGTYAGSIKAPNGYTRGRILDVGIFEITETFACDTTTAKVRLGTTGDADAYAELIIPDTTAATDTFNTQDDTDAVKSNAFTSTQIELTTVQSADSGTAAGIATPYVVIDWFVR